MRRLFALATVGAFILMLGTAGAARKVDATKVNEVASTIDRHLDDRLKTEKITASPLADDAEFLRRVYLDLTGRIPPSAKAIAFLDSKEPNKRQKLVADLLASKEYGKHFGIIWRDLIIRPDANQIRPPDTTPLVNWLAEQFDKGTGWDKIVHDMLIVEGSKPEGLFFVLNGDSRGYPQSNVIAGSVGQLFMGMQVACAECHHHPFVDSWKQEHFWGMAAFFGNVKTTAGPKGAAKGGVAGITEGKGTVDKKRNMNPTMKGTSIVIPDTSFKQIGKTVEAQFPQVKEKPKLVEGKPYRPAFVNWLTSKENPYFAKNAVNRMWAHLFGKGFANPVGEMSEVNPPSHPELLDYLAKEFAKNDFDLKWLITAITSSQAYQRTSRPVPGNKDTEVLFARQEIKVMTPEVLYNALTQALETDNLFGAKGQGGAGKKGKAKVNAKTASPDQKTQFLALFTTKEVEGDSTEFSHGIPQALRLMNQESSNTGGNTLERVVKEGGGHAKIVEGLYLAVLSRRPTEVESKEMVAYVEKQKSSKDGYRGVFWTLLNSAEFIINR